MSASSFRMFGWVSDGTYDKQDYLVRYHVIDGMPKTVISKGWIDNGGPADVDPAMRLPWGSYPDMPPKPPKN